jgi:hypothetical protein
VSLDYLTALFITEDYIVLNDWMIVNSKGCGTKQAWPNVRNYSGVSLEGLRKTTTNLRVRSVIAESSSHFHVLIEHKDVWESGGKF